MFYGYSAYQDSSIAIKMLLLLAIAIITDLLVYQGIKTLINFKRRSVLKKSVIYMHWAQFLFFFILILIYFVRGGALLDNPLKSRFYYFIITIFSLFYIPKLVFILSLLMRLILSFIVYFYTLIIHKKVISSYLNHKYYLKTGLVLSFLAFLVAFHGLIYQKFNFKIRTQEIYFFNLPQSFDGLSVIQNSDIHTGS